MKIYRVGGSVRDELLGLPLKDRDWVVVGATQAQMEALGYKPVGRDFPVFLHPRSKEEYALARTERKTAPGYRGFVVHASPEVTLEEDLARRDLTINAMARDADGALIDPHGGARDLAAGVLRHVSPAFAEDPVRILRVARFAARYGFAAAPETRALMRAMVDSGEGDALVAERVWMEFSRGLMERSPSRLFAVLADCGLLGRALPELRLELASGEPADLPTRETLRALDFAAREGRPLDVRYALATRGARGDMAALGAFAGRLRVPVDCREAARLAVRAPEAARADAASAEALLALIEASDALRRPGRLEGLIAVAEAESYGARGWVETPYPPRRVLRTALAAAVAVDAGVIAQAVTQSGALPAEMPVRVRAARLAAVRTVLAGETPPARSGAGARR